MSADFWAGYISGAASIILGNPLDVLKVRLQAGHSTTSPKPPGTTNPLHPPPPTSTAYTTYIRPFLLGTAAPVLGYGALNALLFVSYNRTEAFLNRYLSPPSTSNSLSDENAGGGFETRGTNLLTTWLAGAAGGLATWVVSAPTELVKCRAQLEIPAQGYGTSSSLPTTEASGRARPGQGSATSLSIARQILHTHGLRGLYFGGGVTAVRDSVGYGFYFWGYELCSRWMSTWAPPSSSADGDGGGGVMSSEAARVLLCGGLAGIITWASIFPLDVIKTRMQAQPDVFSAHHHPRSGSSLSGETTPLLSSSQHRYPQAQQQHPQQQHPHPQSANTNPTRHTAWAVAKDTYRAEGWRAFFRGLGVCSARAFVVNAVQWAVYEWIMAELGQGRRPQQQQQQNNEEMRVFSG